MEGREVAKKEDERMDANDAQVPSLQQLPSLPQQHHHQGLSIQQLPQQQQVPSLPLHNIPQQYPTIAQPYPIPSPFYPLFAATSPPTTHNLIPPHIFQQQQQQQLLLQQQQQQQQQLAGLHLNGTPGYPPALIPSLSPAPFAPPAAYTVQDRPMVPPVFNGVNPNYPGLRVVNTQPPIFCVDNFLSPFECEFLIQSAQDSFGPAPVVGKGAGEVSSSRTSREDLPDLMRKVSLLTGKPAEHCELPQVGRYFPSQQYLQHYDAFDISTEDGRRFAANGGQRTVTCLIYLNTVMRGGATHFPALNLQVQPVQGMALIFFPATVDGLLDKMSLHAALPAVDTKFVSQIWIRQAQYNGQPSKRLAQTLGVVGAHYSPSGLSQLVPSNGL